MPREVVPYTDTMSSWPRRHIIVMDFNSLCIHLFLATSARHCRGLQQFVCIYISSWPRRASARHCRGLHIHLFLAASGVGTSLLWTSYTSLLGRVGRRHVIAWTSYTSLLGRIGRRHVIVTDFIYISSWPRRASARHCCGLQQSMCIYISSWPRR
jgi:hypothetical protein